ncbi:MAG TPA: hypothetical protein VG497_03675, partial [Kribbella sp.]|nr:hypothetical protein [Kribbella sp.]
MTFMSTRAALKDALSAVPGITGYVHRPNLLAPGDAFALLTSADRGPGDAFSATWTVVVILGGDEYAAQEKLDLLLPDLVQAIDPIAYVDQATPAIY